MSSDLPETRIREIEHWTGSYLHQAITVALSQSGPDEPSQDWVELMSHFKVIPLELSERKRLFVSSSMLHGAPITEFRDVITAIIKSSRKKLKLVKCTDDSSEKMKDRFIRGLDDSLDDSVVFYRSRVFPKKSMFSEAMSAAESRGKTAADEKSISTEAFVNTCNGCGAPRLRPGKPSCSFCGQDF
ncbi:MAG: hypothetical protein JXR95_03835 [Deltaproteobacteria bacterium]|nr:hypothetical protein [Deltaproteobacteria bacterium]